MVGRVRFWVIHWTLWHTGGKRRAERLNVSASAEITIGPFFRAYQNLPESDCGCLVVVVWYTHRHWVYRVVFDDNVGIPVT